MGCWVNRFILVPLFLILVFALSVYSVCVPLDTFCQNNNPYKCGATGLTQTLLDTCTSSQVCYDPSGTSTGYGAQCMNVKCDVDGVTGDPYYYREDNVKTDKEDTCSSTESCSGGACQSWLCTPNSKWCSGTSVAFTCHADGLGSDGTTCSSGYICSGGSCIRDCSPTTYSSACYSNDVYYYDKCGVLQSKKTECNDGTTYGSPYCSGTTKAVRDKTVKGCSGSSCTSSTTTETVDTCESYEKCSSGSCVNKTCTEQGHLESCVLFGNTKCSSNNAYECKTSATGDWCYIKTATCGSGEYCYDPSSASIGAQCFTLGCSSSNLYYFFKSDGTKSDLKEDCLSAGKYCSGTSCITQVCTPGAKRCNGTSTAETCKSDGSGWTSSSCSSSQVCDSGSCRTKTCAEYNSSYGDCTLYDFTTNPTWCSSGNPWECIYVSSIDDHCSTKTDTCTSSEICVDPLGTTGAHCECNPTNLQYSSKCDVYGENGDVYWYDNCGTKRDKKSDGECGVSGYGSVYCVGREIYKDYIGRGCSSSTNTCYTTPSAVLQSTCANYEYCSSGSCSNGSISSVSWSKSSVWELESVTLTANVSNIADGVKIKFRIFENDAVFDDDLNILYANVSGGKATINYIVPNIDDGWGAPEIAFTASVDASSSINKTSVNLPVTQLCSGTTGNKRCNSNSDGIEQEYYNSNCTTYWSALQTCSSYQKCSSGSCVDKTCEELGYLESCTLLTNTKCSSNKPFECQVTPSGKWCYVNTGTCASGEYCFDPSSPTIGAQCFTLGCSESNVYYFFKTNGTKSEIKENCLSANKYCSNGTCVAQACVPGSKVCRTNNIADVCKTDGSGTDPVYCTGYQYCSGGVCEKGLITSVSWNKTTALEGDIVTLTANVSNIVDGTKIDFNIFENDLIFDDVLQTLSSNVYIGKATVTYTIPNLDDGWANPELAFIASVNADKSINKTSVNLPVSQGCVINSVTWSKSNAVQWDNVTMNVNATGCDGKIIDFEVWEDDGILLPDDFVFNGQMTVANNSASRSWVVPYIEDQYGGPEYYFTASYQSSSKTSGNVVVNQGTVSDKTFENVDALLGNEKVTIIVFNSPTGKALEYFNLLKTKVSQKTGFTPKVLYSSDLNQTNPCWDYANYSANLILIGDESNNLAIKCFKTNTRANDSNDAIEVQAGSYRNPWVANKNIIFVKGSNEYADGIAALKLIIDKGANSDGKWYEGVIGCLWTGDLSFGGEIACNVIPIVELAPDIRDTYGCVKDKAISIMSMQEPTLSQKINELLCGIIYAATGYDVVSDGALVAGFFTLGATGVVGGSMELADPAIATFKVTFKSVLNTMNSTVIDAAWKTYKKLPKSGSSIMHIMAKVPKESMTAATEAIAKMLAEGPIVAEKGLKLLDKSEALLKSMNPKTVIDAYTSLFKVESKLGIKVSPIVAELGNQTDEYLQNLVKLASDEKFFTKVSNIKSQLGLGSKVTEIKFVNVVADKVTAWGKFESGVIKIATDNPSLTANPQYAQVMLKNIVPHEMGHASFSGITGNLNDAAKYATEELGVDKLLRNKLTGADLDDYLLTEKAMLEGTDFIDLVKNGADEGLADAAVGYAKALKYGGDIPNNIKAEVLSAGKDKFLAAYGRNMKPYESQAFVDGFVKYSDDIAKGADELAVNSNWLPAALITMPVLLATAVAATPPQCESGVCCDTNGYYMNSTNACAVNFSFEMQCSGLNIQKRNSTKYCSGSSSTCDGSLVWGNWVTQSTCPSNQVCSNAVCITPVCSTNSQCGTNSWVDLNYCNSNNIWGKYRTFTCNNPGTIFASCTYADSNQLRINCSAGQICSNATCITPICSNNSDCGVNAFIGNPFCFSNSVMQAFRTFTCNNPATLSASCSYVDSNQIKSACSTAQYCSNATCVNKECTSGACCDSNGFFKSSSNVCQLGISSEKKCESSSVLLRTSDKYCSGISSACDGNTIWNSWSLSNTCASSEYCSNGACVPKQCVTGVCCDANGFFKSNTNICDSNVSTSKYCEGNKVMRVSLVQMCSGSSNTCLGNIVTNPPVLVQTCSSSEYCSSGACVPKQCTSGACCDVNGFFKPSTVMCNLNADNETVCFNSTSTITRTAVLYCSGSSSVCDGNKVWLGWKVPINCSVNQLCQSGICVTKQCTSGACCDTNRGLYQPRGLNCASAPSEARCNGNSVELRSVNYTCGGDSAVCGSENLSYGSWAIDENCASNEYCSEGICTTAICSNDSECNDTNQYTIDACINPSTSLSSCTHTPVVIACSSAVQCGTNGWVNTPFCSSNSIKDAYRTYVCNNAATPSSSCSFTDVLKVKSTCPSGQICNNAECLVPNCINDSGCNDNNSLTIDKCLEPNTVFSSCTHTQIACTTSTQCGVNAWLNQNTCNGNNIGDYFRTFTCKNPGTVTSLCTFTDVLKTKSYCASGTLCQNGICVKPTCSSSTQCNDLNAYTVDLCINAGKLTSACTHTPVRCLTSADCNDFNPFTLDSCKNPKLVTSYCAYTQIACMTNANCDDNNPLTIDSCSYPKTTSSRCNHVAIKCATNANCDDSNSLTSNICINPGTTASYCKYYPLIPTTIWSVAPTSSGKYFSSTTCNTLSKVTCPNELGWVGNRVTYSFNLPLGQLTDNLALKFNVISKNDLNNTNVLLKLTTGISTFNLKLVNPGLEINRLGEFSVIIPKSNFTQGTTNYIQLYGTNITQVGTGKTPPNFKIDSISLNQVQ